MAERVTVLLFGPLREAAGVRESQLRGCATVRDAWAALSAAHPQLTASGVRAARNEQYCDWDTALRDGDVVAFIPPVAGGSPVHAAMVDQPIDVDGVIRSVGSPRDGAVASFIGIVRDDGGITRLDYEAYAPMAVRELQRIGAELQERFDVSAIALVHRTGELQVGDASVVIAVAAPHRSAALQCCADAIELIKRDLPVWKRENRPDGAHWVDARSGAATA